MKSPFNLVVGFALALAAATLQGAATLSDDEIREAYHISYRYEKAQNYDDAIKSIAPVLTAYPQGYTVNLRLGWLYYLSGNYANAKTYYQAAMKSAPASLEAKLGYTLPLLAQARYDETETITKQIVRVDASNYYASLRLAFALRMQKKFEAAEEVLNRLLLLYPTDVKFLTELGLVKVAQDQHSAARRIFADVLTLDPENVAAKEYLSGASKPAEPKK
jgi:tetratricopeptide (TPR) repeat protein